MYRCFDSVSIATATNDPHVDGGIGCRQSCINRLGSVGNLNFGFTSTPSISWLHITLGYLSIYRFEEFLHCNAAGVLSVIDVEIADFCVRRDDRRPQELLLQLLPMWVPSMLSHLCLDGGHVLCRGAPATTGSRWLSCIEFTPSISIIAWCKLHADK